MKAIIFDCDGTLVDSEVLSNEVLAEAVAEHGLVLSVGEKIKLSLSLTGLSPFFEDRIFSSYEVGAWKPDPGLFLHAAKAMDVAPEDCAVVEDSLPGIRAGLAAGMTVFAFEPHAVDPDVPDEVTVLRDLLTLRILLADGAAG